MVLRQEIFTKEVPIQYKITCKELSHTLITAKSSLRISKNGLVTNLKNHKAPLEPSNFKKLILLMMRAKDLRSTT